MWIFANDDCLIVQITYDYTTDNIMPLAPDSCYESYVLQGSSIKDKRLVLWVLIS